MLNTLPPSPVPHPPLLPPRRRRGGQPSNCNAFKHGLFSRQHPAPVTRFSNYLARYTRVEQEQDPASLVLAIKDLRKQIDFLAGLIYSLPDNATLSVFLSWLKVLNKTTRYSLRLKGFVHGFQKPYRDLQYVAGHALSLVFYEFQENNILRDADSFRVDLEKSDLNSVPFWDASLSPLSQPDFAFLTSRQWQVLEPLIPPSERSFPSPLGEWPGEAPSMGARSHRGRPPADPHLLLDAIFWKIAHHARWQDLPAGCPSMAACRRYYRRIFRSGRLATLYRRLYDDLCIPGRVDLAALVERDCFRITKNKLSLSPGIELDWQMRTALLFMQPAYQSFRRLQRAELLERRIRLRPYRLPRSRSKKTSSVIHK
jgi:transposase